jgi:HNH endonuclease
MGHLATLGSFGKEGAGINKEIIRIIEKRAGDYCETCGEVAQLSMALHHRKLKRRGGRDTPSNLIRIHHGCHNLNTDSIHLNPATSLLRGWMVSSWDNPEETPFLRYNKVLVILQNDGTITATEKEASCGYTDND